VHIKGLDGRPREIEDRKYGMCVPQSLLSSSLIMCCTTTTTRIKKKNERQSKMGVYVDYGR
jgi:hypothetical protein